MTIRLETIAISLAESRYDQKIAILAIFGAVLFHFLLQTHSKSPESHWPRHFAICYLVICIIDRIVIHIAIYK